MVGVLVSDPRPRTPDLGPRTSDLGPVLVEPGARRVWTGENGGTEPTPALEEGSRGQMWRLSISPVDQPRTSARIRSQVA